jgi:hypothetical protein
VATVACGEGGPPARSKRASGGKQTNLRQSLASLAGSVGKPRLASPRKAEADRSDPPLF